VNIHGDNAKSVHYNAKNCVQGILVGDFPHMAIKAYEQYQAGNSMCPIGENNAFCTGWDENNQGVHEYGGYDCSNQNTTINLIGCREDYMKEHQVGAAGLAMLAGTWNYWNESKGYAIHGISGIIKYNRSGDFHLTVPVKKSFRCLYFRWIVWIYWTQYSDFML
jgi:hypothetical protein